MGRGAHIGRIASVGLAAVIACGGGRGGQVPATAEAPPATVSERLLAMLPQGAQVVLEVDLARLRANPVVGAVVTRALAGRTGDVAGVPAPPLAVADQVVLAAYGVGTAQAATITLMAAPHDIAGATRLLDGYYAVGPPEWVGQVQQRTALAGTGVPGLAIHAEPELLTLRGHAMPAGAPGASLRVTARLPFDARISLARQTGIDASPAQISAWADVVDDLALVVDCDAADPGASGGRRGDPVRRLEATLRGALATVADQTLIRRLGLPSSLAGARLIAQGTWVRMILAIGPAHLRRVVERAAGLLDEPEATLDAAPAGSPAPPPPNTPPRGDPP